MISLENKNPFWLESREFRMLDDLTYSRFQIAKAEVRETYNKLCEDFGLRSFLPIDTSLIVNDVNLGLTMAGCSTFGHSRTLGRVHLIGLSVTTIKHCWEKILSQVIPHEVGHSFIDEFDPQTNITAPHGQLFIEVMDYLKAPRSMTFISPIPVETLRHHLAEDFSLFSEK